MGDPPGAPLFGFSGLLTIRWRRSTVRAGCESLASSSCHRATAPAPRPARRGSIRALSNPSPSESAGSRATQSASRGALLPGTADGGSTSSGSTNPTSPESRRTATAAIEPSAASSARAAIRSTATSARVAGRTRRGSGKPTRHGRPIGAMGGNSPSQSAVADQPLLFDHSHELAALAGVQQPAYRRRRRSPRGRAARRTSSAASRAPWPAFFRRTAPFRHISTHSIEPCPCRHENGCRVRHVQSDEAVGDTLPRGSRPGEKMASGEATTSLIVAERRKRRQIVMRFHD